MTAIAPARMLHMLPELSVERQCSPLLHQLSFQSHSPAYPLIQTLMRRVSNITETRCYVFIV